MPRCLSRCLPLSALCLATALAAPAQAGPVTLSAGESAVFNFNFAAAGATPAAPYTAISVFPHLTNFEAGDSQLFELFSGLDASDTLSIRSTIPLTSTTSTWSGDLDGEFSVRITAFAGSFTVDPMAQGYTGAGFDLVATGVIAPMPTSVPEPGSLALAGLPLALLAACRRRPARQAA